MADTTILLIRHAEAESFRNGSALLCGTYDAPLNANGREQVELLRERLANGTRASAVYSSPLSRALDTASAAPGVLHGMLRRLRSVREIHCGSLEGWPLDRIKSEFPDVWSRNVAQMDERFSWPGGESYASFRRRVLRGIRAIARQHPGERVLVFTHAGVVNQVVGFVHGQSAARWENYRPGNASITTVIVNDSRWELDGFDDRSHLRRLIAPA